MLRAALVLVALAVVPALSAQTPPVEFDVVSIKRSPADALGSSMRNLPDGTAMMTNTSIRSFITLAAPVPVREVSGLPDWAEDERYDVIAKPPAGATPQQRREMWRTLFADRMKLVAHVEEHERDTFALVLAHSDGRLGPQLQPSTLDCTPRPPDAPPPALPPDYFERESAMKRCGALYGQGSIVSGGTTMDRLVPSLRGLAGREVNNRTGLQGNYAFTLTFSTPRPGGASPDAPLPGDPPEFFTALQEQLGLKLQPEKTRVSVFVIDRLERPTEN
jgi:uncharacterized protein (TIGR03435 family)